MDPSQLQPSEHLKYYVLHVLPLDQPGGGLLCWKQLGPHVHQAVGRFDPARGRRLAEAMRSLDPAEPAPAPLPHDEWDHAMQLVI